MKLSLSVLILVVLFMFSARSFVSHAQMTPTPQWFCTTASDSAPQGCFEPKNIQLVVPVDRYIDLASGSYVQMTPDDWARFVVLYPIPGVTGDQSASTKAVIGR